MRSCLWLTGAYLRATVYFTLIPFNRELRQQVEDKGFDELDLGPDEHHLNITDKDLTTAQQKEILRLKQELGNVTSELEALKIRVRI